MAGHSQFKNIMHRKGAQDEKRAKKFTKLVREVIIAARTGGSTDPQFNPRLRAALGSARAMNLPKDRIDNALKKASSTAQHDLLEEITYEAYYKDGLGLVIEAATDNRNRTASEVRSLIGKRGGSMGESGAVTYAMHRLGWIEFNSLQASPDDALGIAIECGATNYVYKDGIHHVFECKPSELHTVRSHLAQAFGSDPDVCILAWKPATPLLLAPDDLNLAGAQSLIEELEELDDVQRVFTNFAVLSAPTPVSLDPY